jgi:hypothetical protein
MDRKTWSKPVSADEMARRAAGRARHNALRKQKQQLRRLKLAEILASGQEQIGTPGYRIRLAALFGVCPQTIQVDVRAILDAGRDA